MAEEEVWVKLKRQLSRKQQFECKLSLTSRFKSVSETIRGCLNIGEMQNMINETQFGKLILFAGDYNLSSQILWFLMVRQSYQTIGNELWMVVNQRPLRFSKMEYALITGLDCSEDYPEVRETFEFRDRHFKGNEKVYIEQVGAKLKEMRSTPEGTINLEKLKLACLYFGAAVLWPVRQKTKPQVDDMLLSLVDDLDLFNKYPWGTMAFKEFLRSLKRDLIKNGKQGTKEKVVESGSFSLSGFVHPLQILAYECIPGIAKAFAKPREGCDMLLPRMCQWISNNWHLKSSPRYDDVVKASYESNRVVIGVLSPTEEELQAPWITNGQFDDTDPHLSHIVPLLSGRKNVYCYPDSPTKVDFSMKKHEPFKVDTCVEQASSFCKGEGWPHTEALGDSRTFVGNIPTVSNDFVQLRDYIDEKFTKLQAYIDERFTKIEKKVERIQQRFTKNEKFEDVTPSPFKSSHRPTRSLPETKRKKVNDVKCVEEETMLSEGSTSPQIDHSMIQPTNHPSLHTPQCIVVYEGASNADLVRDASDVGEKKAHSDISLTYVRDKRQIKKSAYLSSPFMQLSETPHVLNCNQVGPYNDTFQPLQILNSSKLLIAHMKQQIKKMKGCSRQCLMADYDQKWFNDLLSPRSWLGSSHIHECMNGFLELQRKYPQIVAQDIAVMGGYFSALLDDVHSKVEKGLSHCHWQTLVEHAEGSSRKWKTVPWKYASHILLPYCVPNHWVAVNIDIKATTITIYDCNIDFYKESDLISYVRPLQDLIPRLLSNVGIETTSTWMITRPLTFPQNISGGDCGAWTIKTIEVELARCNPYDINDKIVDSYRPYLTSCTWNKDWIL